MKKWWHLTLLMLLLLPAGAAQAQDPPDAVNDALAALNQRLDQTLTLDDLASWNWEQRRFTDTSLGCPAPGQTYAQQTTLGYIFNFTTAEGTTYDYRVSNDRQTVFLCLNGQPATDETAAPTAAAPTQTPAAAPPAACDFDGAHADYMPTRLSPSVQARVVDDGIPNRVRQQPTLSADIVTEIPAGDEFAVLDGPMCADGLVWWQVDYEGRTGWTAEGDYTDDGEPYYWLEVLAASPPAPPETAPAQAPVDEDQRRITADSIGTLTEMTTLQHDYPVTAPAVVSGSLLVTGTEDGQVHLWNTETGTEDPPLSDEGHAAPVSALALVQPDAAALGLTEAYPVLASGDTDGVVILWDPAARTQTDILQGHTDAITSLALSLEGSLLASGSADGTVRFWNVATGEGMAVITAHTDAIINLTFNAEGTLLISASADGTTRIWGLPQE